METKTKVCSKCGRELPLEKFSKGSGKDGLQYVCKDCASAYTKEYAERKKAEKKALKAKEKEEESKKVLVPSITIETFDLAEIEKTIIKMVMASFANESTKFMAKVLGISERTFFRKMNEYGLSLTDARKGIYPVATKGKTLMDYQPRDLLQALWKMGYDGYFFTYVKQEMTLSKLFGENK